MPSYLSKYLMLREAAADATGTTIVWATTTVGPVHW
jgi:hypothetical protein